VTASFCSVIERQPGWRDAFTSVFLRRAHVDEHRAVGVESRPYLISSDSRAEVNDARCEIADGWFGDFGCERTLLGNPGSATTIHEAAAFFLSRHGHHPVGVGGELERVADESDRRVVADAKSAKPLCQDLG
jgi:hypothetical protein